jgi:DNA-binding HxlR family transcriptional regulator
VGIAMAKICKDGFDIEVGEKDREFYSIAYTQNLLSGRWKPSILWYLKEESSRFNEIKQFLNNLSQGSLTKQLRELEEDGLIQRQVFPEVPPRVEYSLTTKGKELLSILELMRSFGDRYRVQITVK